MFRLLSAWLLLSLAVLCCCCCVHAQSGAREVLVGLRIGSLSSAISAVKDGRAQLVPNAAGHLTTPTFVARGLDNGWMVGEEAQAARAHNRPEAVVFDFKRLLGRDVGDRSVAQGIETRWPFRIAQAPTPAPDQAQAAEPAAAAEHLALYIEVPRHNADGSSSIEHFTAPQLLAELLKVLKADAERFLGEPVTGAVVAVPDWGLQLMRPALAEACDLAGLPLRRVTGEVHAALEAHGLLDPSSTPDAVSASAAPYTLVAHWGGGMMDLTLAKVGAGGGVQVVGTVHNGDLGGEVELNHAIAEGFFRLLAEGNGEISNDFSAIDELLEEIEAAKRRLATHAHADIRARLSDNTSRMERISRLHLDAWSAEAVAAIRRALQQLLSSAAVSKEQVGRLLATGGSMNLPVAREFLLGYFDGRLQFEPSPVPLQQVIALGAGRQAQKFMQNPALLLQPEPEPQPLPEPVIVEHPEHEHEL